MERDKFEQLREAIDNVLLRNETFAAEVCREFAHLRRRDPSHQEIRVSDAELSKATLPAMPEGK